MRQGPRFRPNRDTAGKKQGGLRDVLIAAGAVLGAPEAHAHVEKAQMESVQQEALSDDQDIMKLALELPNVGFSQINNNEG